MHIDMGSVIQFPAGLGAREDDTHQKRRQRIQHAGGISSHIIEEKVQQRSHCTQQEAHRHDAGFAAPISLLPFPDLIDRDSSCRQYNDHMSGRQAFPEIHDISSLENKHHRTGQYGRKASRVQHSVSRSPRAAAHKQHQRHRRKHQRHQRNIRQQERIPGEHQR